MQQWMVGIFSLILVLSLGFLVHGSNTTGLVVSPELNPISLPSSPSLISFSDPSMETGLQIVTPFDGDYADTSSTSFITLFQMYDTTPILKVELKIDNDPYVQIPSKEIEIVEKNPQPGSLELAGRIIRLTDRFENKLKPTGSTNPGMHTLRARITTVLNSNGLESAEIKYLLMPLKNGANFSSMFDGKTAFFADADGSDCKKKKQRECVRSFTVYLMGNSHTSVADQKKAVESSLKDIAPLFLKACVTITVKYKVITMKTTKGYNPANDTITDIEDFFHSVHTDGKVADEDGTHSKDFSVEMGSWSAKGPTPMIVAPTVYQDYDANPQASQHGLTFKSCAAVTKTDKNGKPVSSCNRSLTAYTLVAPSSESGVMAHEVGHKFLEESNFAIEDHGIEQHHTIDYKSSQSKPDVPLPADNFMRTPVPSGTLNMTDAQAGAIYEVCKDYGKLALNNGVNPVNYCVLVDTGIEANPVNMVCQSGEGSPNAESCWGNTIHYPNGKWKAKVPSNFNPDHDVCPVDNDCPGGLICDPSDCHCHPDEGPTIQGGPSVNGPNGSGTSQGANNPAIAAN